MKGKHKNSQNMANKIKSKLIRYKFINSFLKISAKIKINTKYIY